MLFDRMVNKDFRWALIDRYPRLEYPPYMALFRNLLYREYEKPVFMDGEDRHILTHGYLATINGKGNDLTNFNSGDFLNSFRRDVLPDFKVTGWSHKRKQAREVIQTGIPVDIYHLVERYKQEELNVLLGTGVSRLYNRGVTKTVKQTYDEAILEADRLADEYGISDQARKILRHHNHNLSTNIFARQINPNLAAAYEAVESLEKDRDRQRFILQQIELYPKPVLTPVSRADRLFEYTPLLGSIKSEVRRILTRGPRTYEIDLQNSQTAIVAKLWGLPQLAAQLEKGSIWDYLGGHFESEWNAKDAFKKVLYSTVYGAGNARLLEEVSPYLPADANPQEWLTRFQEIPLMADLYQARQQRMDDISRNKKNGIFVKNPLTGEDYRCKPNSEMALEAQAIELDLISAVYDLHDEYPTEFTPLIYSYDGCTIRMRRQSTEERFKRLISEAVSKRALEKWGVHTGITWERLS